MYHLATIKDWHNESFPSKVVAARRRDYTIRLYNLICKYRRMTRKGENRRVENLREILEDCLYSLHDSGDLDYATRDACGLTDW